MRFWIEEIPAGSGSWLLNYMQTVYGTRSDRKNAPSILDRLKYTYTFSGL